MVASRAAAVQALLAERFPDALPSPAWRRGTVATGLADLDRILPSGGFQRGRLATWAPGVGAAALLRSACVHAVAGGERVAWVDATRSVTAACWPAGPILVRPATPLAALRAAEELGRSGGFALVVLDGTEPDSSSMVRCSRAAHEGGAALVLLTASTALASLRLSGRTLLPAYRWRASRLGERGEIQTVRIRLDARASGWHASTELAIPVWHDDLRVSVESRHPDRRGERR